MALMEELTKEYENKIHQAYQTLQDDMTNTNVLALQKLLLKYPENENLELDGFYSNPTIEAVKSFYSKHYWTPERKLQTTQDMYGEKYILQAEMESMRKELEENDKDENMKEAFPDTDAISLA